MPRGRRLGQGACIEGLLIVCPAAGHPLRRGGVQDKRPHDMESSQSRAPLNSWPRGPHACCLVGPLCRSCATLGARSSACGKCRGSRTPGPPHLLFNLQALRVALDGLAKVPLRLIRTPEVPIGFALTHPIAHLRRNRHVLRMVPSPSRSATESRRDPCPESETFNVELDRTHPPDVSKTVDARRSSTVASP